MWLEDSSQYLLKEIISRLTREQVRLTREQVVRAAERLAKHDAADDVVRAHHVAEAVHYLMGGEVPADRRAVALEEELSEEELNG